MLAFHHLLFDIPNGFGRVQALGTSAGAVHDGMAPVKLKGIFEGIEALTGGFIPAVHNPAVRL